MGRGIKIETIEQLEKIIAEMEYLAKIGMYKECAECTAQHLRNAVACLQERDTQPLTNYAKTNL